MASDARKTRTTIDGEAKATADELQTQLDQQKKHAEGSRIAADALGGTKSKGTDEGHRQREQAAQRAEDAVKEQSARLVEAETKISNEGKAVEGELTDLGKEASTEANKVRAAQGRVDFKPARAQLDQVAKASEDDSKFVTDVAGGRTGIRVGADSKTKSFGDQMKALKVKLGG